MATLATLVEMAWLLALIGCFLLAMWASLLDFQDCVDDEFCEDGIHVVSYGQEPVGSWRCRARCLLFEASFSRFTCLSLLLITVRLRPKPNNEANCSCD